MTHYNWEKKCNFLIQNMLHPVDHNNDLMWTLCFKKIFSQRGYFTIPHLFSIHKINMPAGLRTELELENWIKGELKLVKRSNRMAVCSKLAILDSYDVTNQKRNYLEGLRRHQSYWMPIKLDADTCDPADGNNGFIFNSEWMSFSHSLHQQWTAKAQIICHLAFMFTV